MKSLRSSLLFLVLAVAAAGAAEPARSPSPPEAQVYFISPTDGDTVSSPVTIRFGLRGMGVAPAGVPLEGTGHHHLIVDAPLPPSGQPIPNDAHHLHFGKGQTEATLELAPGVHRLQLLVGDHGHRPHEPVVASDVITITVR